MLNFKKHDKGERQVKGINEKVVKIWDMKNINIGFFKTNTWDTKLRKIKSKLHQLEALNVNKVCLSRFDDKRYTFDNVTKTLAYGYKYINCFFLLICKAGQFTYFD